MHVLVCSCHPCCHTVTFPPGSTAWACFIHLTRLTATAGVFSIKGMGFSFVCWLQPTQKKHELCSWSGFIIQITWNIHLLRITNHEPTNHLHRWVQFLFLGLVISDISPFSWAILPSTTLLCSIWAFYPTRSGGVIATCNGVPLTHSAMARK